MTQASDDEFADIEQTQAELRANIEKAKALALESERLIRPAGEPEPEAGPPDPA